MTVITVATFSYRAGGVLYKLTSGEEQLVDEAFLEAEDLVKDLAVEAALVVATFGLVKFVQKGLSLFKGAKKAAAIARFKRNIKYGAKAERYVLGKIGGKKAFKTSLGTVIPDQVTKTSIKEVKNVVLHMATVSCITCQVFGQCQLFGSSSSDCRSGNLIWLDRAPPWSWDL